MNTTPTPAADVIKAASLLEERAQVLRHMSRDDLIEVKHAVAGNAQWQRDLRDVAFQAQKIVETMRKGALEKRIQAIDVELASMGVEIPADVPATDRASFGQGLLRGSP